jgi:hypothetical protein
MDYYFLDGVGGSFKATLLYDPYFLIAVKPGMEGEVEEWTRRKFEGLVKKASRVLKEDLSMVSFAPFTLPIDGLVDVVNLEERRQTDSTT